MRNVSNKLLCHKLWAFLGREISNVMAVMWVCVGWISGKKNKVTPEPMSKLFSSLSTDLRRFDCIISGMSRLCLNDTRTMQILT